MTKEKDSLIKAYFDLIAFTILLALFLYDVYTKYYGDDERQK